jgi:hypothetical protein
MSVSDRGAIFQALNITGSLARPFVHRIGPKLLAARLAADMANVHALDIWRKQHKRGKGLSHKHSCYKEQTDEFFQEMY